MNFLEVMLVERLKDADSNLDITGSDRKVLQVACEDITNYLKFHWNLIGNTANQCELVERLEQLFKENPRELEEFLAVWTSMWFKKWKERVKLLIGEQHASKWHRASKNLSNAEPLWKNLAHKQELREIVAATFIKNGEICGTEILSENLLKMELGEKRAQCLSDKQCVFFILNNALRKARDMAQSKGPLIFVKVDKAYYSATNP
jgi:lipopolysaccharide biosynthesis glycosyltransferase